MESSLLIYSFGTMWKTTSWFVVNKKNENKQSTEEIINMIKKNCKKINARAVKRPNPDCYVPKTIVSGFR
jgi:hypothetical protein